MAGGVVGVVGEWAGLGSFGVDEVDGGSTMAALARSRTDRSVVRCLGDGEEDDMIDRDHMEGHRGTQPSSPWVSRSSSGSTF